MTDSDWKQPGDPTSPSYRFIGSGAWFTFACILAAMTFDAWRQGIWGDEIWSLWMSETGLPASRMLHERWVMDVHPPLFYFTNWVFSGAVGEGIFSRRLLNLLPALYALGIALYAWTRSARYRPFVLLLALVTFTSSSAVWYFAEHRSYFWILSFAFSLVCLLRLIFEGGIERPGSRILLSSLFFLTTLVSLNLHYVSVVIIGSVLGASALVLLMHRQWRSVSLIVLSTLVSLAPLIYFLRLQLPYMAKVEHGFWIKTTPVKAVQILADMLIHSAGDNLVVLASVVLALSAMRRRAVEQGPGAERAGEAGQAPSNLPTPSERRYIATLLAGLVFAIAVLIAVNLVRPIIIHRYLVAIPPIAAAIVSVLAYRVVFTRKAVVVLLYANAAALLLLYSIGPIRRQRWEASIDYVQAQLGQCPTGRVYALDSTFFPYPVPRAFNEPMVQNWGYQRLARAHGFEARVIHAESGAPAALATDCPTLFWAEHVDTDKAFDYFRRTALGRTPQMQRALSRAKAFGDDEGMVIEVPPAASLN